MRYISPSHWVALLAEGVDRNFDYGGYIVQGLASPSSQRAWIEIPFFAAAAGFEKVALLAEGVDRNQPERCDYC